MAKATPKITLGVTQGIPFDKLVLSQSNVRRVERGQSIEDLAASIARRGLLQSLNVRPVLDGEGNQTGVYEIPAGGRRYQALELLVRQKRMHRTEPVPCIVVDASSEISAEEDSLAENVHREELHPLDQFRAFQDLREKGVGEEDIAARFFVPVNVVRQRLKLAGVSPKLLEVYAAAGMTLDQLMAFTVRSDHERQEQVWEALASNWSKEPYQIRRMLTENTVRVADRRVRFVTLEAYEAAGGTVLRDLFESDDGGWVQDITLLDRLVAEKLASAEGLVTAEGWKWVVVAVSFPYGHTSGLGRIDGTMGELSAEEKASLDALTAEQERLEEQYPDADELPEDVDLRLGEIETAIEVIENRPVVFSSAEIGHAGAFVSIGHDGVLVIERGYVRPDDADAVRRDNTRADDHDGRDAYAALQSDAHAMVAEEPVLDDEEDDGLKPLPERLLGELTAHRTLALRDAVAGNPHVALTLLLHRLVSDRFLNRGGEGCLQASVSEAHLAWQPEGLGDTASATAIAARQDAWAADIPSDGGELWGWLTGLDDASRLALLAHCVSFGVNALHEKPNPYGAGPSARTIRHRLDGADRLAQAVALDMVEAGWRPTVDSYLGRVTKARIIEAVREATGDAQAQLIDHLKKTEMAERAAGLLSGTGWLPELLRTPDLDDDEEAGEGRGAIVSSSESVTGVADCVPAVAAE